MKKILALFLMVAGAAIFAQELPAFKDGSAYVFDANAVAGKAKDAVKLVNSSEASNFTVWIYGWNAKKSEWVEFGAGFLKECGDRDTVDSKYEVKKFQYYAVKSSSDTEFKFKVLKARNDLIITFASEIKVSSEGGYFIDSAAFDGSFKDNIKLISLGAADIPVKFYIFGAENKDGPYEAVAIGQLVRAVDTCTIGNSLTDKKLTDYRFFKLVSDTGLDYKYDVLKMSNDLIINIKK